MNTDFQVPKEYEPFPPGPVDLPAIYPESSKTLPATNLITSEILKVFPGINREDIERLKKHPNLQKILEEVRQIQSEIQTLNTQIDSYTSIGPSDTTEDLKIILDRDFQSKEWYKEFNETQKKAIRSYVADFIAVNVNGLLREKLSYSRTPQGIDVDNYIDLVDTLAKYTKLIVTPDVMSTNRAIGTATVRQVAEDLTEGFSIEINELESLLNNNTDGSLAEIADAFLNIKRILGSQSRKTYKDLLVQIDPYLNIIRQSNTSQPIEDRIKTATEALVNNIAKNLETNIDTIHSITRSQSTVAQSSLMAMAALLSKPQALEGINQYIQEYIIRKRDSLIHKTLSEQKEALQSKLESKKTETLNLPEYEEAERLKKAEAKQELNAVTEIEPLLARLTNIKNRLHEFVQILRSGDYGQFDLVSKIDEIEHKDSDNEDLKILKNEINNLIFLIKLAYENQRVPVEDTVDSQTAPTVSGPLTAQEMPVVPLEEIETVEDKETPIVETLEQDTKYAKEIEGLKDFWSKRSRERLQNIIKLSASPQNLPLKANNEVSLTTDGSLMTVTGIRPDSDISSVFVSTLFPRPKTLDKATRGMFPAKFRYNSGNPILLGVARETKEVENFVIFGDYVIAIPKELNELFELYLTEEEAKDLATKIIETTPVN